MAWSVAVAFCESCQQQFPPLSLFHRASSRLYHDEAAVSSFGRLFIVEVRCFEFAQTSPPNIFYFRLVNVIEYSYVTGFTADTHSNEEMCLGALNLKLFIVQLYKSLEVDL